MNFDALQDTVYAKMVQKVGNRHYWEQWASDIAGIANKHIKHIEKVIKDNPKHAAEFDKFLEGLQKQLNPSITKEEAIEMLSQHLITRPVFEALFKNYTFAKENPVSQSMQKIIDILDENKGAADEEQERTLGKFYESVQESVEGIENAAGRQKVILELYDKFFKTALPLTVEKLGIVYTPVEVVDFIINSVADVLKKEFGRTLSEENVHILDPFTGTGTFVTRLLQSGHIKPEDMKRKYQKEIHANEIVLLAYYIASINIENTYHGLLGAKSDKYESFNGICLTDTFQTSEYDESLQLSDVFPQNSERVEKQKKCPLTVILGNPPYSVGQKSANDNAQNQKYEKLDGRVEKTYAKYSTAKNKNSLYDSYIKAFRWASDRLSENKNGGVIGFITNSGWIDKNGMDGFRQCLEGEFSKIYIFNLRGSIRAKNGDLAKREGQNVFNIMTGVAITILVKNPTCKNKKAIIHYRDIGEYLSRKDKLKILTDFKSVLSPDFKAERITPNEHNDWLNKRSDLFENFIPIGDKDNKNNIQTIFVPYYSNGLKTQRDAWCYNYSKNRLLLNMSNTIDFYNSERKRYFKTKGKQIESSISTDTTKISWSDNLFNKLKNNEILSFNEEAITESLYRPFSKQYLYYDRVFNERRYQMPKLFPTPIHENFCICVTGIGARQNFSTLMTDKITDLSVVESSQCFPLYWYEKKEDSNKKQGTLFDSDAKGDEYIRHDGITDFALQIAHEKYGHKVMKEDLFYYIYGLLHSPDYRKKFASDLKKMLPHIPFVDSTEDFDVFSQAGRKLADLHLNYENQKPLSCVKVTGKESKHFKVDKIRFKSKEDKSEIMFNSSISITGIPKEAHDYSVNGRTPIEWILERYQIKTDKDSQITNDPNDWAAEHENPRYILDLLLSVITMSVETVKIIDKLPKIDFEKLKA